MSDTLKEDQNSANKPPEMEDFWRGKELTPGRLRELDQMMYDLNFSAAKYLNEKRSQYLKEHPGATLPKLPDYLELENYQQKS